MILKFIRNYCNSMRPGSMIVMVGIGLYFLVKHVFAAEPVAPAGNLRDFLEGLVVGLAFGSVCYRVVLRIMGNKTNKNE